MNRPTRDELIPDHCARDVVVLCCGNVLFGDDGFGPAVAQRIHESFAVPDWAAVIDAGTAVRELLIDIIVCERRPTQIVIVDAVDVGRTPGEVFEIPLDDIPKAEAAEFSVHQAPTANLLQELREAAGVRVAVIVCQVETVPEGEMSEEISPTVRRAIDRAALLIRATYLADAAPTDSPSP